MSDDPQTTRMMDAIALLDAKDAEIAQLRAENLALDESATARQVEIYRIRAVAGAWQAATAEARAENARLRAAVQAEVEWHRASIKRIDPYHDAGALDAHRARLARLEAALVSANEA